MRTRSTAFCTGILLTGLTLVGCKKEYYTDEVTVDPTGPSHAVTDTLSFSGGWEGFLDVDSDSLGWTTLESLGHLEPATLFPGDRVIAILQVGLNLDGSCADSMYVSAGTIIGTSLSQTPEDQNVELFNEEIVVDKWVGPLLKQFVRVGELTITDTIPSPKVQAFAKPWSPVCGPGTTQCFIANRSLTLVIVHEQ